MPIVNSLERKGVVGGLAPDLQSVLLQLIKEGLDFFDDNIVDGKV